MPKAETPSTSRKRERILDAATELFSRYGYERTTVDLIAAESRCAKGTVYTYFEDKEGIFRAVATEVCARFMAEAEGAVASPGRLQGGEECGGAQAVPGRARPRLPGGHHARVSGN